MNNYFSHFRILKIKLLLSIYCGLCVMFYIHRQMCNCLVMVIVFIFSAVMRKCPVPFQTGYNHFHFAPTPPQ